MRLKLFMLLSLFLSLHAVAQSGLRGVVVDSKTNVPVVGATVLLDEQGVSAITGPNGDFIITDAKPGKDKLLIFSYGYRDLVQEVEMLMGIDDLGTILLESSSSSITDDDSSYEVVLTETQLEDEEGNAQQVGALTGATDNPYYKAANFNFSIMRFRIRGYNNEYSQTYINGINFNDAARGRFNYSMTGGMNWSFRSKSIGFATEPTSYGFGDVGGATNIYTFAKDYAPGFRASVTYTNGNYQWRGRALYSSGLNKNGLAMTIGAIVRYSKEGIIPGSFYNSIGAFLALQKVFNNEHSVSLTVFGAPTRRASNSATFDEAYQLAGSNLYNVNWGWQEGKKRNARVTESFDPTAILNWLWTPKTGVTLNTGLAFHKSFYSSSAIERDGSSPDPRPDYYRYLPSYYRTTTPESADLLEWEWLNMEEKRQINWNRLYQINYLNNYEYEQGGEDKGSSYIVEKRHSNQFNWILSSNLNMRITDFLTLQGGVSANYSRSSYYKTLKDLLGGRYWLDVDHFAERDFPGDISVLQNDMDNPNCRIMEKDRFGYDYNINSITGRAWAQNVINLNHFDFNYGLQVSATSFQRDGKMRNGRAPENSKGKGERHSFINYAVKVGAIFKIDGRNNIQMHAYYGTRAPEYYNAYISARIKDDVITDLKSARILSGDIGYVWNYRKFMGSITGFWTEFWDMTERTSFYDDYNSTFVNYALTGVQKEHKGVEFGAAYKLTPSFTINAAATVARYQYKNRPLGTRSFENGSEADITQTVYLKNFYVGGTPQEAYSLGFNWSAPNRWFFEINGAWMNRSYVDLSPIRHEVLSELYTKANSEEELMQMMQDIGKQEKLNEALVVNLSIGKLIYLNRRASMSINLNLNNLLNNTSIQTGGYQQGRFDYKNYTTAKFPNKYYYAQGIRINLNVGVRF